MFVRESKYISLQIQLYELEKKLNEEKVKTSQYSRNVEDSIQYIFKKQRKIIEFFKNNVKDSNIDKEHNDFYGDYYVCKIKDLTFNIYKQYNKDCGLINLCDINDECFINMNDLKICYKDILKIVDTEYQKREEFKRLQKLSE